MRPQRANPIWLGAAVAISLFLITTCPTTTTAQNTFPTPSGNVGIGTTNPELPLDVNGNFKWQDVRHYRVSKAYGANPGDWAEIGSFANTGVSQYAEFQVQGHWCGSIISAKFRFDSTAYNMGAEGSTNWIELPVLDGGKSWNGTFQPVAIDVKRSNLSVTSDPIQVRVRNLTANCNSSVQSINIQTNTVLAEPTPSNTGTSGTVDTGYMGSNIGWKFPVVQSGWSASTQGLFVVNSGNVGIGTTGPYSKLSLTSSDSLSGISLFTSNYEAGRYWGTRIYKQDSFGGFANGIPLIIDSQYGSTWYTSATFGAGVDPHHPSFRSYGQTYLASDSGNVGIGTTNPLARLNVQADATYPVELTNAQLVLSGATDLLKRTVVGYDTTSNFGYIAAGRSGNGWTNIALQPSGGNVGIGTTNPGQKLDVVGGNINVSSSGGVGGNITISGTINAKYQDVAEWVPSSEQLSAGTVVVLDSTKSNQVTSSSVSYDTRVAGVISAQPGIALGEKADNKVLVATTGRVKIKVDATKSPICIGDLLVTSDVPGVAMKSEAVNLGGVQFHRPGTLIGKALEPLDKGKAEILVLLSLQ